MTPQTELRRPATLIIEPSDPDAISQLLDESSEFLLTAFSYHGTGADFHYYPYRIVGNDIHLYITHFSGYGTGASNEGDRTAQQGYIPTDANARANQRIAETMTEEARKQQADPDYDPTQTIMDAATEALRTWLHESVLPMTRDAETNDRVLDCAVIERFLYLWAETQLMFDDDVVDDLDDRLMRITRFELEMESTISCTAGSGSTFVADYAVIGVPPYDHPDCGGRRMARSTPDPPEPEVSMFVGQGLPVETFVLQCEGSDMPFPFTSPLWAGGFAVLHQPNYEDPFGFHIGEWDMNLAQPYATKSFDHADDNVHESATFTLWYAPLP